MEDIQTVVNKFLDNMDQLEDHILWAIAHLIEVEMKERDYMSNPQNFPGGDDYEN
jgi:uncharacterized tellurite resistance protein B-like protein